MEVVGPPDALDEVQGVAVRVAHAVQPGLVVEIYRVGDQRVSLPMPDRIAHPQGAKSFVMLAAVCKNLMAHGIVLEKHDHLAGRLNDLHRKGMHDNTRVTWGSTCMVNRVVRFREGIGTSSEGGFGGLI